MAHHALADLVQLIPSGASLVAGIEGAKGFANVERHFGALVITNLFPEVIAALDADGDDRGVGAPGEESRAGARRAQHRGPTAAFGEDGQNAILAQDGLRHLERAARPGTAVGGDNPKQTLQEVHHLGGIGHLRAAHEFHRPGQKMDEEQRIHEIEVVRYHQ